VDPVGNPAMLLFSHKQWPKLSAAIHWIPALGEEECGACRSQTRCNMYKRDKICTIFESYHRQ